MTAESPSRRRSAVQARARRARKMARDGAKRARIAADLGVSIRIVDGYLAAGRAAAPKPRETRPASAGDLAAMAEPGKPKHRYKDVGYINRDSLRRLNGLGGAAHPTGRPFQPPTLASVAFAVDWTDEREIARKERARAHDAEHAAEVAARKAAAA